jgi:hypothetical protein
VLEEAAEEGAEIQAAEVDLAVEAHPQDFKTIKRSNLNVI